MQTQMETTVTANDTVTAVQPLPRSAELASDVERLRREELEAIDRRRQAELARLRRMQDQD